MEGACGAVDTAVCVFSGRDCDLLESDGEEEEEGKHGHFSMRLLNLF